MWCVGFPGMLPAGGRGDVQSRCGVVSFLCCWAAVSHVPGWGRGVRCGMVALGCVVDFPLGGGASCPGLVGWVVALGASSGGAGQSRAVSRSSIWRFPVLGRCGIVAVRGLGSPGIGCVGLECRNQGGVVAWCFGVSAHRLVGSGVWGAPSMGHVRAATFVGSAGRWVVASRACCCPGAAPVGDGWLCVAGVYGLHGGGGALGSGAGWVRGRLPAGSGRWGLTVGGSSVVSPWCVLWWPLVGWLWGPFRCTASMGAPLCVGRPQWGVLSVVWAGLVSLSSVCCAAVRRVSSSAVPHGGLLWRCVGGGLGAGGSPEGAGHAGSGWPGGGGACVSACTATLTFLGHDVPGVSALCCLRGFLLCLSPAPLCLLVRFVSNFEG